MIWRHEPTYVVDLDPLFSLPEKDKKRPANCLKCVALRAINLTKHSTGGDPFLELDIKGDKAQTQSAVSVDVLGGWSPST